MYLYIKYAIIGIIIIATSMVAGALGELEQYGAAWCMASFSAFLLFLIIHVAYADGREENNIRTKTLRK